MERNFQQPCSSLRFGRCSQSELVYSHEHIPRNTPKNTSSRTVLSPQFPQDLSYTSFQPSNRPAPPLSITTAHPTISAYSTQTTELNPSSFVYVPFAPACNHAIKAPNFPVTVSLDTIAILELVCPPIATIVPALLTLKLLG